MTRTFPITESTVVFHAAGRGMSAILSNPVLLVRYLNRWCGSGLSRHRAMRTRLVAARRRSIRTQSRTPIARHRRQRRFRIVHRRRCQRGVKRQADGPHPKPDPPLGRRPERVVVNQLHYIAIRPAPAFAPVVPWVDVSWQLCGRFTSAQVPVFRGCGDVEVSARGPAASPTSTATSSRTRLLKNLHISTPDEDQALSNPQIIHRVYRANI
jgi:hypothetical protein